jgi:hypothetical protein
VPLSEHEQRLLDQIERALYAEDPKFASAVRHTDLRSHLRRRIKRMAVLVFVGFAAFLTGLFIQEPVVAGAGFVVMVIATWLLARAWLKLTGRSSEPTKVQLDRPRITHEGGWRARLEERWQRRNDERGM